MDLRFFANVNAIYDTGLVAFGDGHNRSTGRSRRGLWRRRAGGSLWNATWRTASLGLDYKGNFRHYDQTTYFDGSDQQMSVGLHLPKVQAAQFDFKGLAGTYSQGFGGVTVDNC